MKKFSRKSIEMQVEMQVSFRCRSGRSKRMASGHIHSANSADKAVQAKIQVGSQRNTNGNFLWKVREKILKFLNFQITLEFIVEHR